jgi:20S proteasome alpha/beta subunit
MTQTAVEWLEKQLLKNGYVNKGYHSQDSLNHLENLFLQAKEMEKEQTLDFIRNAVRKILDEDRQNPFNLEQYYNETIGLHNT